MIFDEVITGFGRTGAYFATETFDIVPDMITFAKGLTNAIVPAGAVIEEHSKLRNLLPHDIYSIYDIKSF